MPMHMPSSHPAPPTAASRFTPALGHRVTLVAALTIALLAIAACSGPQAHHASWEDLGTTNAAPSSATASAAAAFAAAQEQYTSGAYSDALVSFRLFGAEYPTDPLAVRAELYAARSNAALGDTLAAEAAFRSLYDAPDGPETRAAAAAYVGFVRAQRGETAYATEFLIDALAADATLSVPIGWIVDGDEALLASLLAEARIAAHHGLLALNDLALVAEFGDDALREYAVDRALEVVAAEPDLRTLQTAFERAFEGGSADADGPIANDPRAPFVIAAIAPELATRRMLGGDLEGAREVLLRGDEPALRWGRPERLAEVRESLESTGSDRPIRYGVALSLTGNTRRAGRAALGAVLLAQRVFESRDPVSSVVIRDTQGTAAGTQRAIAALAAAGVSAIIGPIEADLTETARQAASQSGIPLISLSAVPFASPVHGTYRWLLDARAEAARVVEEAFDGRNVRSFVIVSHAGSDDNAFMSVFADAAAAEIQRRGGQVLDRVSVQDDADDAAVAQASARAAARAIASTDAAAVVLALPDDLTATVVAYLASEDIWPSRNGAVRSNDGRRQVTVLGNSFARTDRLLLNSGDYVEGGLFPVWFSPELATGAGREFADRFTFTFARDPGTIEAFAFDAARAMRRVLIDEGIALPQDVIDRITVGVSQAGAVGALRFDSNGNPDVRPQLSTVSNGRFVMHDGS